jgi:beta-glucosidase
MSRSVRTKKNFLSSKKVRYRAMGLIFFLLIIAGLSVYIFFTNKKDVLVDMPSQNALYKNPKKTVDARVEDLLKRMTLKEKVGQMTLIEKKSISEEGDIPLYGIGGLLSGAGANPENNSPEGWFEMVSGFTEASKQSRLGIPILYGVDAVHGHTNVVGATIFPHAIGLGATGNADLVYKIARATAREIKATGVSWSFSPNLDLPQDIRWGRTYEAFGDDPVLAGTLGAAYVKGLEEVKDSKNKNDGEKVFILSTLKHYIGLGGMRWGTATNPEYRIDQGVTEPSEELLRSVYLPPFREAVEAGAGSVMIGLNTWGDTKLAAQRYLVTDVLKGELGFDGIVVSDWYGVYEIPGSEYDASVIAINAGIDMVMVPFEYKSFTNNVISAVSRGDISMARIDDSVRRILRAKFRLGLFDESPMFDASVVGSKEHRTLAREAVSESLVLLKNEAEVLPLRDGVKHIRVAGSAADNIGQQSGAWTIEWQGVDGNWFPGTSILTGIKEVAGSDVRVEYSNDGTFENDSEYADVGIAVVGESPYAEGVGDRESPKLSAVDLAAIERLRWVSKKVVVILISGRPLIVGDALLNWDAVVAAWLPGSEGAGVADVLFGKKPFLHDL